MPAAAAQARTPRGEDLGALGDRMPVLSVVACWAGPIERGERVLEPLRRHGRPLLDLIAPKPYLAHQSTFDATVPHGLHYYWRSE